MTHIAFEAANRLGMLRHTHTSCSEACSGCVRCLPADLARHLREPFRSQVCRIEGIDRKPTLTRGISDNNSDDAWDAVHRLAHEIGFSEVFV